MSFGIRIRGNQGQLQVSDQQPVYMVVDQGLFGPENWFYSPGMGWRGRHYVQFTTAVTTQEPPLIFIKFDSGFNTMMEICTPVGKPGAWDGFAMVLGWMSENGNYVQAYARSGAWFIASCKVQPSNQKVGIRIREAATGSVIYDSGYPLVRFAQQTAQFSAVGRENHYWLRYSIGWPEGAYVLANMMTGLLRYKKIQNTLFTTTVQVGVRSGFAGALMLWVYDRFDVDYQDYMWTALFAYPGK